MSERMDGLISFFASYSALRAEAILRRADFLVQLIPGPKELSPNCGVALRFSYDQRESALALLTKRKVNIDEIHYYISRTDEFIKHRGTNQKSNIVET